MNIRILATSNRDLAQAVKAGTFREDLLYRLNVVNLRLPALRERPADVLALAEFFVKKYAGRQRRAGAPACRSRPGAGSACTAGPATCASWRTPCTARCCSPQAPRSRRAPIRLPDGQPLSGPAMIDPGQRTAERAAQMAETAARAFVGQTVAQVEQQLILDTLVHCFGNRTHAANILGISIRTLRNKLKE